MKINTYIFICLGLLLISSCSAIHNLSMRSSEQYDSNKESINNALDSIAKSHFDNTAISEITLECFTDLATPSIYTPTVNITEDFTSFESNKIKIGDDALFCDLNRVFIDFSAIDEKSFAFPISIDSTTRFVSKYGIRHGRRHEGVDVKSYINDTIYAAFDGIVRVNKRVKGYGNVLVLRHYNGTETVYAHNVKNMTDIGNIVTAGTPIAIMGRTGRATGTHLHFEIRVNGQAFDPTEVIDFEKGCLKGKAITFYQDNKDKLQYNIIQ